MVTKKDIIAKFSLRDAEVEQIGSKQLFIIYLPPITGMNYRPAKTLLVSYYTVVGYFNGVWHLTKFKYSPTTSKQLTQFADITKFQVEWIAEQITLRVR